MLPKLTSADILYFPSVFVILSSSRTVLPFLIVILAFSKVLSSISLTMNSTFLLGSSGNNKLFCKSKDFYGMYLKLTKPNVQIKHFIPIDCWVCCFQVNMGCSFSSDTIRFRAYHKCLSFSIANFKSFLRFIFLLKNVEVRISALIAGISTIRSFVKDSFLEEIKASCLSGRDFQITFTSTGKIFCCVKWIGWYNFFLTCQVWWNHNHWKRWAFESNLCLINLQVQWYLKWFPSEEKQFDCTVWN